jgi:hypothetical protein
MPEPWHAGAVAYRSATLQDTGRCERVILDSNDTTVKLPPYSITRLKFIESEN